VSKVLVFEECPTERRFLQDCLSSDFETHIEKDPRNCLELTLELAPDIVVMDLDLKSINVIEAHHQFSKHPSTQKIPVLLLGKIDANHLFQNHSNLILSDTLAKPVTREALLEKIQNRLKLQMIPRSNPALINNGHFTLNTKKQIVNFSSNSTPSYSIDVVLTDSETQILTLLMRRHNEVISREELCKWLCAEIKGKTFVLRQVDTLIFQLRKKLKPFAHCFQTVYGKGYRLHSKLESP